MVRVYLPGLHAAILTGPLTRRRPYMIPLLSLMRYASCAWVVLAGWFLIF